jgi:hypothetical protein
LATDYARFRTAAVARASGMRPKKLLRLLDRNVLRPSDRDRAQGGQGNPRAFTEQTAQRFALAHTLMSLGLPPAAAAQISERCHRPSGLLVIDSAGAADVLPKVKFSLPVGAVVVDLDGLNSRVSERLAPLPNHSDPAPHSEGAAKSSLFR